METNLLELIQLEHVPVELFEHPPLILTACQLRFTSVLGIASQMFVAPFQQAIQKDYPFAEQKQQWNFEFPLTSVQVPSVTPQAPSWQFKSADDWSVTLITDSIVLETRTYRTFDDFIDRFRKLISALSKHIQPAIGTRLGLRYINEIRSNTDDLAGSFSYFREVISPQLLGPLGSSELEGHTMAQAIQQIQLRYGSRQGLNIRHGNFPGGSTVVQPEGKEADKRPFYLLDIDAFYEVPTTELASDGIPIDEEEISNCLNGYNKAIYRLFRWAVTEHYIETLDVIESVR